MEEILFEGQIYYFVNGVFVDSNFLMLPQTLNAKIANAYFSKIDYTSYDYEALRALVKKAKASGAYEVAERVCEHIVNVYAEDLYLINGILATYASILRTNNKPQKQRNYMIFFSRISSAIQCTF